MDFYYNSKGNQLRKEVLFRKAKKIKLVLTDCDGVLTDTGVYYSKDGEALKRFSIRDGMGVERLRLIAGVETGIITGENSEIVKRRAEKLQIDKVYLGVKDKAAAFKEILSVNKLNAGEIAFIGDDTNDLEIIKLAGFTACPADATKFVKKEADLILESRGGNGAFRDLAELIIEAKTKKSRRK